MRPVVSQELTLKGLTRSYSREWGSYTVASKLATALLGGCGFFGVLGVAAPNDWTVGLATNAIGAAVTILVIDRLVANSERERIRPIRQVAMRSMVDVLHCALEVIRLGALTTIGRRTHGQISLLGKERLALEAARTLARADVRVPPPYYSSVSTLSDAFKHAAEHLCRVSDNCIDRFGVWLPPTAFPAIEAVAEAQLVWSMMNEPPAHLPGFNHGEACWAEFLGLTNALMDELDRFAVQVEGSAQSPATHSILSRFRLGIDLALSDIAVVDQVRSDIMRRHDLPPYHVMSSAWNNEDTWHEFPRWPGYRLAGFDAPDGSFWADKTDFVLHPPKDDASSQI